MLGNRQDHIKNIFQLLDKKDLERIRRTDKEYLFFNVFVTNAGATVQLICTDHPENYHHLLNDGYSFYMENSQETIWSIEEATGEQLC